MRTPSRPPACPERPPTIHLGGYGEPMGSPRLLAHGGLARRDRRALEMTTNGTAAQRDMAAALIEVEPGPYGLSPSTG